MSKRPERPKSPERPKTPERSRMRFRSRASKPSKGPPKGADSGLEESFVLVSSSASTCSSASGHSPGSEPAASTPGATSPSPTPALTPLNDQHGHIYVCAPISLQSLDRKLPQGAEKVYLRLTVEGREGEACAHCSSSFRHRDGCNPWLHSELWDRAAALMDVVIPQCFWQKAVPCLGRDVLASGPVLRQFLRAASSASSSSSSSLCLELASDPRLLVASYILYEMLL